MSELDKILREDKEWYKEFHYQIYNYHTEFLERLLEVEND